MHFRGVQGSVCAKRERHDGPKRKIDFSGVRWGRWVDAVVTLYLRACESRLERPILGDRAAAEAVERIDYNWARMRRWVPAGQPVHGRPARQAARRVGRRFSEPPSERRCAAPGCGLDSRVFRLGPPATVQWFDVDQPDVIELRRRLYSDRDGYQMIASSVTDPAWLESIPADRPALVVAEGLLMYLTEAEARQLLSASPTGSAPASCCAICYRSGVRGSPSSSSGNARRSGARNFAAALRRADLRDRRL